MQAGWARADFEAGGEHYALRPAMATDLPWLRGVSGETGWSQLGPVERAGATRQAVDDAAGQMIAHALAHGQIIVAETAGRPVGYVALALTRHELTGERQGFLLDVYVEPSRRRLGVARRLVAAAEHVCRRAGVRQLALAVARGNLPSGQLAEAAGFEAVRLLMLKRLDPA